MQPPLTASLIANRFAPGAILSDPFEDSDVESDSSSSSAAAAAAAATTPYEFGYEVDDYDHQFKLVVIGSCGCGKTSLSKRFCENAFAENSGSTIGAELLIRTVRLHMLPSAEVRVQLMIWDTAGAERFAKIVSSYYRGAAAAIVVFDLTRRATFDDLAQWFATLDETIDDAAKFTRVLVGNKCDRADERAVTRDECTEAARAFDCTFYLETSAKHNLNVDALFLDLTQEIFKRQKTLVFTRQRRQRYEIAGVDLSATTAISMTTVDDDDVTRRRAARHQRREARRRADARRGVVRLGASTPTVRGDAKPSVDDACSC